MIRPGLTTTQAAIPSASSCARTVDSTAATRAISGRQGRRAREIQADGSACRRHCLTRQRRPRGAPFSRLAVAVGAVVELAAFGRVGLLPNPAASFIKRMRPPGKAPGGLIRLAVAVGFEPTESLPSHAFEACSFGRSDTPPPRNVQGVEPLSKIAAPAWSRTARNSRVRGLDDGRRRTRRAGRCTRRRARRRPLPGGG